MQEAITDIVVIDGPAGAGKTSLSRRVAASLGYAFLDTGAMYRAATWRAIHNGVDLDDPVATAASTRAMRLEFREEDDVTRVLVDGQDVTDAIRVPEVTNLICKLDQNLEVRALLVELQRAFARNRAAIVAEGRDMGTVVFPKARCKIYLDASIEVRAQRRADELRQKGIEVEIGEVRKQIEERDRRDMERAVSPLCHAADAILLDTSGFTLQQNVDRIVTLARSILSRVAP